MEEGVGDGRKEKIFLRQIFVISIEPHREKKQREIFRNVDGGHRFQAWPHIFSTYDGVSASCAGATNFSLSLPLPVLRRVYLYPLCVHALNFRLPDFFIFVQSSYPRPSASSVHRPPSPFSSFPPLLVLSSLSLSPFHSMSSCLSDPGFLSRFFQLYIYILYLDISWRETDDESSSKRVS